MSNAIIHKIKSVKVDDHFRKDEICIFIFNCTEGYTSYLTAVIILIIIPVSLSISILINNMKKIAKSITFI